MRCAPRKCACKLQPAAAKHKCIIPISNEPNLTLLPSFRLAAHGWQRVPDLTTQPAPEVAFVHVSFGLNVWNPQLTVATFNKPGIRALFVQSIKNIAPGGWEKRACSGKRRRPAPPIV